MRVVVCALLALATTACPRLSTDDVCGGLTKEACQASSNCHAATSCRGASTACTDARVCSPATCQPTQRSCVINGDRCQPGRVDAGFDCERVPDPGGMSPAGFACKVVPDPCEGCKVDYAGCQGRPTPLFGR